MTASVIFSAVGVVLALAILVVCATKRVHLVIAGIFAALICAVCSGGNVYSMFFDTYLGAVGSWVKGYLILFIASATLGQVYSETGAARSIGRAISKLVGAKHALLAIVVVTAILTYGGISCFVIVFAVYPVALVLLQEGNISNKLSAGAIGAGCWTFAMTGPFSTQLQNTIPASQLGTSPSAGGIVGFAAAIAMFVLDLVYLNIQNKKLAATGEGFVVPEIASAKEMNADASNLPHFTLALIPLVFLVVIYNVFQWAIDICMVLTLLLSVIILFKYLNREKIARAIKDGLDSGINVMISIGAVVAFGSVTKLTPIYNYLVEVVFSVNMNPYALAYFSSALFSGLLGSATGGVSLALSSLGDLFQSYAASGYSLGIMHRLISIASGSIDSMPYAGAVCAMLAVTGLSHKEGYKHILWTCTLIPLIVGVVIALPLALIFG